MRTTPTSAPSGRPRSAATRACPTPRQGRHRDRAGRADDPQGRLGARLRRPGGEASNMAKYAAAEAALGAVDAAIQTHGGNGLSTEYGLVPYWGLARLLRIAPVNREMVLNFVAQHTLGLPRSY
ncbi:acyl-CoA dehydrogenase family protein [Klenkia terrae]